MKYYQRKRVPETFAFDFDLYDKQHKTKQHISILWTFKYIITLVLHLHWWLMIETPSFPFDILGVVRKAKRKKKQRFHYFQWWIVLFPHDRFNSMCVCKCISRNIQLLSLHKWVYLWKTGLENRIKLQLHQYLAFLGL